jgi:hypothetical protein
MGAHVSMCNYFGGKHVTIFQWLTLRLFKYEIKIRQFIENQINLAREKIVEL